uniref:Uncharacterized protein n=1 Tax=Cacopsylla melanoneura TaxID=428564 RepID=A0A8D8YX62_9HEMI
MFVSRLPSFSCLLLRNPPDMTLVRDLLFLLLLLIVPLSLLLRLHISVSGLGLGPCCTNVKNMYCFLSIPVVCFRVSCSSQDSVSLGLGGRSLASRVIIPHLLIVNCFKEEEFIFWGQILIFSNVISMQIEKWKENL